MRAWIDGKLLDDSTTPAVRVDDHGLVVGDGVFEALKVVQGVPFAVQPHLDRLQRSAAGLGLGAVDEDVVRAGIKAVLDGFDAPLARLRITVTGGPAPFGSGRGHAPSTVIVGVDAFTAYPATTTLHTVPWTRNEHGALAGLKSTSYAENVLALARAHEAGAGEAMFANTAGDLCEGTGTNIFYVLDGELCTPTLASGCLAGITRALVLEWYGARQVDRPLPLVREQASEVFVTSSLRDAQPVVRWDERELGVGPVTRAVQEAWRRREPELLHR